MNYERHIPVWVVFLFVLTACGGTQTAQPTPPNPSPPITTTTTSSDESAACAQFFAAVDRALQIHLSRTPALKSEMLSKGFRYFLEAVATENKANMDAAKKLWDQYGLAVSDCTPYVAAAKELTFGNAPKNEPALLNVLRLALDNFLFALDPNSYFLSDEEAAETKQGDTLGTGLVLLERTDYQLNRKPKYLVFKGFADGSANKGVELPENSRIYTIDGKAVSEFSFEKTESLLNRTDQKSVEIGVRTRPEDPLETVHLETGDYEKNIALFDLPDVSPGIARIRLATFDNTSAAEYFKDQWTELATKYGPKLRGLILDLRGNTGGFRGQAISILETLLPSGSLVCHALETLVDKSEKFNASVNGKPAVLAAIRTKKERPQIPVRSVVVLVDRKSASASEELAAALQDYQRALLLGEASLGKGIGQTSIPIDPLGGAMYVTTRYFFSPAGRNHQMVGVIPDVVVNDAVNEYQQTIEKRPVRMKDRAAKYPGAVPPQANPLPAEKAGFKKPEHPAISDDVLRKIRSLQIRLDPVCERLPNSDGFREEDDCLLAMGVAYLKKLIEFQGQETASR